MEADASNHPDEGMIHAWLDEALEPAEAARIAEHVRGCAECSARVAEARGLIAGASRIIGALDDVPAGARPAWSQEGVIAGGAAEPSASASTARIAGRAPDGSLWRRLRVTPARSAIAATLIIALGITLTRQRAAIETPEMGRTAGSPSTVSAPAPAPMTATTAKTTTAAPDHLLDSAVAKSVAIAHPQRALQAAPGTAIPQAPAGVASATTAPETLAGMRVAAARRALEAERVVGAAERADKARVGAYAPTTPPAAAEALDAATTAEHALRAKSTDVAGVAASGNVGGARQCYLVESRAADGTWGGEALPLLVAVDSSARSGSGSASVFTASGARTPLQARWVRTGRDSLSLTLRRLGYSGAIALGPELAGGRAGIARSAPQAALLEQLVVAGAGETRNQSVARDSQPRSASVARDLAKDDRRAASGAAPGAPSAAPAPAASALAERARTSVAMREYPVTMRPAACPNR
jgi:hypothetical protein